MFFFFHAFDASVCQEKGRCGWISSLTYCDVRNLNNLFEWKEPIVAFIGIYSIGQINLLIRTVCLQMMNVRTFALARKTSKAIVYPTLKKRVYLRHPIDSDDVLHVCANICKSVDYFSSTFGIQMTIYDHKFQQESCSYVKEHF